MFDWEKAPGKKPGIDWESCTISKTDPQPAAFHHKGMRLHQKKYGSPEGVQ
jgi:hypothetical protein